MTLVRILVDGCGLLDQWSDLAPGKPRLSQSTLEEFVLALTQYSDATGTPVTVMFDGNYCDFEISDLPPCPPEVELAISQFGKPVAHSLARVAQKYSAQGEVHVVTNHAGPWNQPGASTISATSCLNFLTELRQTLSDLEQEIARINQQENNKFIQSG